MVVATRYPGIADYNDAAQRPAAAFTDPELAKGQLATSGLGLPIVLGGGFALTYTVTSKKRKLAVRCFHRYVPDLEQRYALISKAIGKLKSAHFVSFEYQAEGVRVKSNLYPIVKMAWAEGPTLGAYLEDNYADESAVRSLSRKFRELAKFLKYQGIAHGDLENGNLVVQDRALALIDYDGMHVPGMALGNGNELGHAHFQHPDRQTDHFGPRIDDFSFILIDLSLEAVAADKSLYQQFSNGDNIIFQKSDFQSPATSALFKRLRRIHGLADKVDHFATICQQPVGAVPSLDEFLAAHSPSKPNAPAKRVPPTHKPAGMSNADFIRGSLGMGASQMPSTVSEASVARLETATGNAAAANPAPRSSIALHVLWWAESIVVVVLLFRFLTGRM